MTKYEKYKDSGFDWIGEIPEHWEVKKLKHCFTKIGSGTTPTAGNKEFYEGGQFNWLQTGDLNNGIIKETEKKVTQFALNKYSILKNYPIGSIVIAMYGATIGKTGFLAVETTTNQACCVFSQPKSIESKYVFYWLNSIKKHIISLSYGGGQPNINQEQLRSLSFALPPTKKEQTTIANYLDKKTEEIDKLITQKKQLLKLYKEEKKAIINQAVTKGINPDVKLKDSGIEWLGDIPEHWEVKKIKYLGKFINGYSFKSTDFDSNGVKVLKISNIQNMHIDWSDSSYVDEKFYDIHKDFRVFKNDLVFALTRPIISTGIKVALIDTDEKILLNQRNSVYRPSQIQIKWFYYLLLSKNFIQEFDSCIDNTGQQPNISSNDIGEIAIPVPSDSEQYELINFIDKHNNEINLKINKTQKLIDLLTEYRTALISEVVTGKIKVTK